MLIKPPNQLQTYITHDGRIPFFEWIGSIKDQVVKDRVKTRLDRVSLGNFGDHKYIGEGVYELRLAFGAGYRIYYGLVDNVVVLLLCGGDKSTQKKDIKKAIQYFKKYKEVEYENKIHKNRKYENQKTHETQRPLSRLFN